MQDDLYVTGTERITFVLHAVIPKLRQRRL